MVNIFHFFILFFFEIFCQLGLFKKNIYIFIYLGCTGP